MSIIKLAKTIHRNIDNDPAKACDALKQFKQASKKLTVRAHENLIDEGITMLSTYSLDAATVLISLRKHGIKDFNPNYMTIRHAVDSLANKYDHSGLHLANLITNESSLEMAIRTIAKRTGMSVQVATYSYRTNGIVIDTSRKKNATINNDPLANALKTYLKAKKSVRKTLKV